MNKLFLYKDGELYWKIKVPRSNAGDLVRYRTTIKNSKRAFIFYSYYYLHRLIFLMHHGYLPKLIDHIDGNPSNNRIENLRAATVSQNGCNRNAAKKNKLGIKGLYLCPNGTYRSTVIKNKKIILQKYFKDKKQAIQVLLQTRQQAHGEFYK
jgi:hypothetical protein